MSDESWKTWAERWHLEQLEPLDCLPGTDTLYGCIYALVRLIPRGKVATYAQIGALLGNSRLCRVVGNAMHNNPLPGPVPCHRVVNSRGGLACHFGAGGPLEQQRRLEKEGVEVQQGKVNLLKYGWQGEELAGKMPPDR